MSDAYEFFREGQKRLRTGLTAQATVPLEKAKRLEPAEGVDPGGARDRLLPARPLAGRRAGVPHDHRRARPDRRLRALRPRPGPRAAGPHRRGERALQARELDEAEVRDVQLPGSSTSSRSAEGGRPARHTRPLDPGRCDRRRALHPPWRGRGRRRGNAERLAGKTARLRIFEGEDGRFERSLLDTGGAALVVSQFTLLADTGKGNRPISRTPLAPDMASRSTSASVEALRDQGVQVETGCSGRA